jgi:hypothetical protein
MFKGPITEEQPHVCHRCDNPKCVNPDHLFSGTHQDNMEDGVKKNRFSRENNPKTKVSPDLVRAIRKAHVPGIVGYRKLEKRFGVDRARICRIITRKLWKGLK